MRGAVGNRNREDAPLTQPALHAYVAAMRVDQFCDKSKPDTSSLERSGNCAVHAVETVEDAWQIRLRNSRPGVLHRQLDRLPDSPDRHGNCPVERKFERVRE